MSMEGRRRVLRMGGVQAMSRTSREKELIIDFMYTSLGAIFPQCFFLVVFFLWKNVGLEKRKERRGRGG
jgi:hypothetical protein